MCLSPAEGMGRDADEDSPGPLSASVGAAGHYDQCVRPDPPRCGEVHQEGDGPVRQQHYLCALPVPQSAGTHVLLFRLVITLFMIIWRVHWEYTRLIVHLLWSRLPTSWTVMLPL